jgi:hypothetical protein
MFNGIREVMSDFPTSMLGFSCVFLVTFLLTRRGVIAFVDRKQGHAKAFALRWLKNNTATPRGSSRPMLLHRDYMAKPTGQMIYLHQQN